MKSLIVLPTYMERGTIEDVLKRVLAHGGLDVLVIDDNSPDGTAEAVRDFVKTNNRVNLLVRPGKLGLGTAYVEGFKWGLARGYECFIEMDSDMSHDPKDIPALISGIENGAGLVIGSRYMGGRINVVGWDFKRLLLSKFGNIYASKILGLKVYDLTSGFRAYSRGALERAGLDGVKSGGYAFQIEMAYRVHGAGSRIIETPIIFTERMSGSSKMSHAIVREAVALPWRLRCAELKALIKSTLGLANR